MLIVVSCDWRGAVISMNCKLSFLFNSEEFNLLVVSIIFCLVFIPDCRLFKLNVNDCVISIYSKLSSLFNKEEFNLFKSDIRGCLVLVKLVIELLIFWKLTISPFCNPWRVLMLFSILVNWGNID